MIRILFLIVSTVLLSSAYASDIVSTIQQPEGTINLSTPSELVATIIKYAIGIAAIFGVIGITWGGIQMILSVGEDEKQKKAKYMLIYSIVGVILAGLAYGIVTIISSIKL